MAAFYYVYTFLKICDIKSPFNANNDMALCYVYHDSFDHCSDYSLKFYEGILISFASKSTTLEIMKTNK